MKTIPTKYHALIARHWIKHQDKEKSSVRQWNSETIQAPTVCRFIQNEMWLSWWILGVCRHNKSSTKNKESLQVSFSAKLFGSVSKHNLSLCVGKGKASLLMCCCEEVCSATKQDHYNSSSVAILLVYSYCLECGQRPDNATLSCWTSPCLHLYPDYSLKK
jgi:hypothetical protein